MPHLPSSHPVHSRPRAIPGSAALLVVISLLLAACNIAPTDTPEATQLPLPTPAITVAASATVNPVLPAGDGSEGLSVGASNPTQAGLAAEGQPDAGQGITITPLPTQAQFPMAISADDGLVLQATYYSSSLQPAPGVLLLHMIGSDRSAWTPLAEQLQATGYAVLALDLRGYGETGGQPDWSLARSDVNTALTMLRELPGVNAQRVAVIGASIGANLGLNTCADTPACLTAVLLSPGLDYRGVTTTEAITRLGTRPVLIVASENDNNNPGDSVTLDNMAAGEHRLVIHPEAAHGTDLLSANPDLIPQIVNWLVLHVQPGA